MFLLSFLVLRLLVLGTGVERVSHFDELDLGTMAREMIQGLKVPYSEYQLDSYSGDSLLLGAAVVPFFKTLGMNLMAVKMVPFLFSLLTLLTAYFFLRRHFGEMTAKRGAWLLVLCPASFVQLSLVGLSGHSEGLLWSVPALFAFYEFMHSRYSRMTFIFLFGLLSGFGFWFYYANGIMTSVCLLSWLILDRKSFFSGKFTLFALGFFSGFSPWLIFNVKDLGPRLDFLINLSNVSYGSGRRTFFDFIKKNIHLFIIGLPNSFVFYSAFGIPQRILSFVCYFVVFLPAVLAGFRYFREAKILPLALYPVVFCLFFGAISLDLQQEFGFIGARYLTPLFFWGLLLLAVVSSKLGNAGKFWGMASLALGLVSQSGLMFHEPAGRALQYKGYSYYQLGQRWEFSPVSPLRKVQDLSSLLDQFSEEERRFFLWGLSDAGIVGGETTAAGRFQVKDFLNFEGRPVYFYEWYGSTLKAADSREVLSLAGQLLESRRDYFLKGWYDRCRDCFNQPGSTVHPWEAYSLGKSSLKTGDSSWAWRGAAYPFFMQQITFSKRPVNEVVEMPFVKNSSAHRPDVFWSFGWVLRESFREDRTRAMDWVNRLSAFDKSAALEGLRFFESWYQYHEA